MAVSYGRILFLYISLVFIVRYRICMMQCNPMPGPGMYPGNMGDIRFSGSQNEASGSRSGQLNMRQIRFLPSYLDFGEQSVGMPKVRTVTIINPQHEGSLQLHSIAGSTVHFHASFFQLKVLPPLGNTTFEVVFLARLVGSVENTLFIHTSKGVYPYQVFGVGVPNPFRLRPFLGARVPVNYSFTSLINMHNPYGDSLQIVEMYSSGGDLHLELPSGQQEAPQKNWEISPYETKALMRVSFLGRIASNHTAFVRIKTEPATLSDYLIIPVEVEVTSAPGLFPSVDLLDFGTLRTMDEPKSMGLYIMNSNLKPVEILSMSVEPANSAITFGFTPMVLKRGTKYIKVGSVTYTAFHVKRSRQHYGKIIVKTNSKSSPRLEIPYQANVLQGTIAYSVSKTRFHVGKQPYEPVISELLITNTFGFTMIIYDAAFPVEAQGVFSIVNFDKPAKIHPQTTVAPFHVSFHANGSDLAFSTILKVYTNASIFTIPIHCYDGKLKHSIPDSPDEGVLDFGTVGTAENRSQTLNLLNNNPIEVTISKINVLNVEFARVLYLGMKATNSSKQLAPQLASTDDEMITIKPGHTAIFHVEIAAPKEEGQFLGNINIITEFQTLHIVLNLKTVQGTLRASPSPIVFQPSFPGRTESIKLSLSSTFAHPLKVAYLRPLPEDPRFYFVPRGESERELIPNKETVVGELKFNPFLACGKQCYTGLSSESNQKWLSSVAFKSNVAELDGRLIEDQREVFAGLHQQGKTRLNVSLAVETDVVRGFALTAQASLTWPSLSPDKPLKFPLTHMGNYSTKLFMVENPADVPVMVHVLPLVEYPQFQRLWDVVDDRIDGDLREFDNKDNSFVLPAMAADRSECCVQPPAHDMLGGAPAAGTLVTVLKPRAKLKVAVHFKPKDELPRSSLILIRNNLTVLDWIAVQGQGARGEFTLNNKRPGPNSVLLFELKPNQLTYCQTPVPRSHALPPLSVMKSVTAVNPGRLAIFVTSLSINGYECEGFGFKVMNCKSFILKPNSSRKIDIAFTPDFTMSRVTRKLEVRATFGSAMEFTLVATIPTHLLPLCAAATGHTSWEPYLQKTAFVVMGAILLMVLMSAYSEARRIAFLSQPQMELLKWRHHRGEPNGDIFDLNAIAGIETLGSSSREDKPLPTKRLKKETNDIREPPTVAVQQPMAEQSSGAARAGATSSYTNNNVNKHLNAATTRQDTVNRNKAARTESAATAAAAAAAAAVTTTKSTCEPSDRTSRPPDAGDHGRKLTMPTYKETRGKGPLENRVKPMVEAPAGLSSVQKAAEVPRLESKTVDTKETKGNYEDRLATSVAAVTESAVAEQCSAKPETSIKKESRESKAKLKKKAKAAARKEEREQKQALKTKASKGQPQTAADGTVSDSSASDAPAEGTQAEGKSQNKPAIENKRPRTEKEQAPKANSPVETQESSSKPRNRKHSNSSNARKAPEAAPASAPPRPKALDVLSGKSRAAATKDDEARSNFGVASPHAIAAAALASSLEKAMHKETTGEEHKANNTSNGNSSSSSSKKKRGKGGGGSARSPSSESPPPPSSPANLSASSRSSSYSSIVSSEGAPPSGDQHRVGNGGGASKAKLKPSTSLPVGRVGQPLGVGLDDSVSTGQPVYHKPARSPELPSVRKSPWSTSLDSAALPPFPSPGPGSPCSPIGRIQFPPIVSSSLFESTPFNANNGADAKQTVEPRRPKDAATPFDLSDLGVSTGAEAAAGGQAAKPSVWDEKPVPAVSSSSLFSSVLRPNNWVNFLDAAGGNGLATQPANKTMSEIWDSGSSALDGWAGYDSSRQLPTTPDGSQQVRPIGSEAHAVDSLFSQPPVDWPEPRAPSPTQHAFGGADLPWSSSVWSSSSGASSTESGCVSPTSGFAFPLSSSGIGAEGDRAQTPPVVTSAYAPLGGSGIWNPGPWSTCKD